LEFRMKTEVSTVTTKGQLVIPSRLRRKYSIKEGTRVVFLEQESRPVLQPLTPEFIRSLRGSLKGEPSALKALLEDRKRERKLCWPSLSRCPTLALSRSGFRR
jgi:AbrB family looped-hinge helix DNA binding protein